MNRLEFFNELTVFTASYPLLTFTEWVWDLDKRLNMGWFMVFCIGINILVNILAVVVIFIHDLCRKIRLNCLRRRR